MKTLRCKLSIAAFLFVFSAANAQKGVTYLWTWDAAPVYAQNGDASQFNLRGAHSNISRQGTEPANGFDGAKQAIEVISESCLKHCPVSDGSLSCQLIAEDYCPMTGHWQAHTNKPRLASPAESALDDLSFTVSK